jgi:hypothetical protein
VQFIWAVVLRAEHLEQFSQCCGQAGGWIGCNGTGGRATGRVSNLGWFGVLAFSPVGGAGYVSPGRPPGSGAQSPLPFRTWGRVGQDHESVGLATRMEELTWIGPPPGADEDGGRGRARECEPTRVMASH